MFQAFQMAFVTFLPGAFFPQRASKELEAVVILEQVEKGRFVPRVIETEFGDLGLERRCPAGNFLPEPTRVNTRVKVG